MHYLNKNNISKNYFVGKTGLEPASPWLLTRPLKKIPISVLPVMFRDSGGSRTHIILLKRQVHQPFCHRAVVLPVGFEPTFSTLKEWCLRYPLGHKSVPYLWSTPVTRSRRLLLSFILFLFHTAKILPLFFISPFLALLVASEGIGPSLVPYDGVLLS